MEFGLKPETISLIRQAIGNFPEIERVLLFGSRAIGNFRPGSDIDLALCGRAVTGKTVLALNSMLNEQLPLPYFFDVVDYTHLEAAELKESIAANGLVFYEKNGYF